MGKKTKKGKVEGQVDNANNQSAKENHVEVVPATIVESSEAQVFAGQAEDLAVSTDDGSQVVDSPIAVNEGDAKPAEKSAAKPKVNRRPYIDWVSKHLELGDMERKAMVQQVLKDFPIVRKGGIETFLTDLLNPKYSHFKERKVTKTADGKLIFADRLIPGFAGAEQDQQANSDGHSTEAEVAAVQVVSVEETQSEQATE